ncbi:MAG: 3'-5' exonuclease [Bacillota bacterium]|nr:3'-5' exonuclease [Bacillota bacterium]
MKYVVVDLEMNSVASNFIEERKVCSMEIIQIGAVVLNEEYEIIGSFSTYVKPQYNRYIENMYQRLTGITTYMVKDAPVFKDGLKQFFSWIQTLNDEIEVYAWSENDLCQILREAELKGYEFSNYENVILDYWYDFQEEYEEKTQKHYKCSLVEALSSHGIQLEGKLHDALYDAKNTAKLLKVVRTDNRIVDCYKAYMNPEPAQNTLGDIFDFNKLGLSFS